MKIVEDNEWRQQVTCRACTSVLDIEFGDLSAPPLQMSPVTWTCCICKSENEIDPKHLPEGRDVRHRDLSIGHGLLAAANTSSHIPNPVPGNTGLTPHAYRGPAPFC